MIKVDIDPNSGFCFGVVNAIQKSETYISLNDELFCLGDIVHNEAEVKRLEKMGLKIINKDEFKNLHNSVVLLRAHGEPPETYSTAQQNHIKLIDATCPVVLSLQKMIRKGYKEASEIRGQIVIFGKKGHAEVNGLVGQADNKAIVISSIDEIDTIDFSKPVELFSQTTMAISEYAVLKERIKKRIAEAGFPDSNFKWHDTICRQVSNRNDLIRYFCSQYEIIIFVSGKKSSNGLKLYNICKEQNANTYFISDSSELDKKWFSENSTVGICGATSTPKWLMEKIANEIKTYY